MIIGFHAIIYSKHADQVRAFLRDNLKLPSVDAGGGWLIFALPPAELAVHPDEGATRYDFYLMTSDIDATIKDFTSKGVEFTGPITEARWGRVAAIKMPGGGELGVYEPRHPTALGLAGAGASSARSMPPKRKSKPHRPRKKSKKGRKR